MILRTLLSTVCLASISFSPYTAQAQSPVSLETFIAKGTVWADALMSNPPPYQLPTPPQYLLDEGIYAMHLVRPEGMGHLGTAIRISQPVVAQGCMKLVMMKPSLRILGSILQIETQGPAILLNDQAKSISGDCPQESVTPVLDIGLKREFLEDNGISKITMITPYGQDNFNIELSPESLTLKPETTRVFKPNKEISSGEPLKHWFYPKDTIVLFIPRADNSQALYKDLNAFAKENGLEPLRLQDDGFTTNENRQKFFLFRDPNQAFSKDLKPHDTKSVGTIDIVENFFNAGTLEKRKKPLDVFVRLPSSSD